ncbi:MAG: CHAD domain-containing protein [Rhodothermales bacterium]
MLRRRFRLRAEPVASCTRRYVDSFDGLLYAADTVCYQEVVRNKAQLRWEHLTDGTLKHSLDAPEIPRFATDIPPGTFRDALASVLELRALLPFVEVRCRQRAFRLLNADEKTTARLLIEDNVKAVHPVSGTEVTLPATLSLVSVKGYAKISKGLRQSLRDAPGVTALHTPAFHDLVQAIGHAPGVDAARIKLALTPEMRADDAVKQVLRALLRVMEVNEPGLRADLDSEFLHDFRVSVRRTRSVMTQLKSIFPPAKLAHFRTEFKWLGGVTGPTRDLDVYLIRFDDYQAWLPASVQEDLIPLRDFLFIHQQQEHARLVQALDSPRYLSLMHDWKAFLNAHEPDPASPADAARPIVKVVSKRIRRVYRQVLKEGNAILTDPQTPAEALHRLRITCKKLRYLLELFRSLYPPQVIKQVILALKQLQNNLGDFQDFEVQQDKLQEFALQMMEEGNASAETLLAMGRLEAHLAMLQHKARAAFAERFTRFAAPKNQQRFQRIFHPSA